MINNKIFLCVIFLLLATTNLTYAQVNNSLSVSYGPFISTSSGSRPSDIAVSDFDHNGRPDIAITLRGRDSLAIFSQLSGGLFPSHASASYYVPSGPASLVSLPLNGYGPSSASPTPPADDLAVGCAQNAFFYFFDNMGTAPGVLSLVPRPSFLWQNGTSISLGNPRLVTGHFHSSNYIDIGYLYDAFAPRGLGGMAMLGNSTAMPQPTIQYSTRVTPSPNFAPVDFSLADFYNSGQALDAILPSPDNNQIIAIVHGVSSSYNGPWWAPGADASFPSFGARPISAAAADVNGDGGIDLVAAHENSQDIVVQLHDATYPASQFAFLSSRLTYSLPDIPRKMILTDLNGDSRPELLVLLANSSLLVYRNTGQSGTALFDLASGATMLTHPNPTYMRLADLNLDGYQDIIVTCQGDDTVNIFYTGNSPLATSTAIAKSAVQVYPNPAHTTIQLKLPVNASASSITMYDAVGRIAKHWSIPSSVLTVADLPRGLYLLRITLPEGPVIRRIVLE